MAENDDLPGIFGHLKAPPVHFGHETLHPREAFDIERLSPNHAAPIDFLAGEGVVQTDFG